MGSFHSCFHREYSLCGEVEFGVHGVQAPVAARAVGETADGHRAKDRLEGAVRVAAMGAQDLVGSENAGQRTLSEAAQVEVVLEELAQELEAVLLEGALEIGVVHGKGWSGAQRDDQGLEQLLAGGEGVLRDGSMWLHGQGGPPWRHTCGSTMYVP